MKRIALFCFCAVMASLFLGQARAQPYAFTNYVGVPATPGTNDGPTGVALFNSPGGVIFDAAGNLVVADHYNHTLRKVTPAGVVSTFAGAPQQGGYVDGPAATARFRSPFYLAFDAVGQLYVSDLENHVIRKVAPDGTVSTFAGGTGQFNRPAGIAFDPAGNLYVADSANHVIRFVTPGGLVLTLAGSQGVIGSADGSTATARFSYPSELTFDAATNLYVADTGNYTIRKITPTGTVSTVAGSPGQAGGADGVGAAARFIEPFGIKVDGDGNLLVADAGNRLIRKVTPTGTVSTLGGLAGVAGTADGIGSVARFSRPSGIVLAGTNAFLFSDAFNHRIVRATLVTGFPQMTTAPASLTFGHAGTTLTVTASGSAPLSYQWQAHGTNLPNATNASLVIAGNAASAGRYRVTVSNSLGTVTSSEAILSFLEGPRFYAGMSLSGVVGQQYRVDYADVVSGVTNWLVLSNLTLNTNPMLVIDPASAGATNRYYRAVLLP